MLLMIKKRRILHVTCLAIVCFFVYQLYFFVTISSEKFDKSEVIRVKTTSIDQINIREILITKDNAKGLMGHHVDANVVKDNTSQFKCLTTDQHMSVLYVNDDYCDCEDGSDEKNTNACSKGRFVCGYPDSVSDSPASIPSSMVNDGICDCCDGTDEWNYEPNKKLLSQGSLKLRRHYVDKCPNICDKI